MKWELLGRVKIAVGRTTSFTRTFFRTRYETLVIHLGPGRQLRCGCKHTWTLLPEEMELPEDADTCIHIKLLYGNGKVAGTTGPINSSSTLSTRGTVYLTDRGKELFSWRFAAQALK